MTSWGGFFDPEQLKNQLDKLEKDLQNPDLWEDHKKLNGLNKEKISLETKVAALQTLVAKK